MRFLKEAPLLFLCWTLGSRPAFAQAEASVPTVPAGEVSGSAARSPVAPVKISDAPVSPAPSGTPSLAAALPAAAAQIAAPAAAPSAPIAAKALPTPVRGATNSATSKSAFDKAVDDEQAAQDGRVLFDQESRKQSDSAVPATAEGTAASLSSQKERPSPAERKVLEQITKEFGPVVERPAAPHLYGAVETMFSRLGAAQEKLFPPDAVSVNRIRIVDSPIVNAFVRPLRAAGVKRSNNMVFITTGLLKKMIDSDPAKLPEGMIRLAGVLAHELAHPLDDVDAEGIKATSGRGVGGQAREIRADAEGARIAKEAGYPSDSVYRSLQRLFSDVYKDDDALHSFLSTHPQDDLRLVMQRMILTLDRYERGRETPRYPEGTPAAIIGELDRLSRQDVRMEPPPKDLAEGLERLHEAAEAGSSTGFNRTLLSIDKMLSRRGADLNDEEFRLLTEIAKFVSALDSDVFPIFDRERIKRSFSREPEFHDSPSHEEYLKKIQSVRTPRYAAWLKKNFLVKKTKSGLFLRSEVDSLVRIVPDETLFAVFGDAIAQSVIEVEREGTISARYMYEEGLEKDRSVEFKIRSAILFHGKILPRLSEAERLVFFSGHIDDYSYVLPQLSLRPKSPGLGLVVRRDLFWNDPKLKGLRDEYREIVRSIWNDRGYFGVLDLASDFITIDWDTIFAVLDIDPSVGRGQIRKAVKDFARTRAYADFLRHVRDDADVSKNVATSAGKGLPWGKNLRWLDDTLEPFLSGDRNEALEGDPSLHAFARKVIGGVYYASRPELFRRRYRRAFAEALIRSAPTDIASLELVQQKVLDSLAGGSRPVRRLSDIHAEAIAASPLPAPTKRELLRILFLEGYGRTGNIDGLNYRNAGYWLIDDPDHAPTILRALVHTGVVRDIQDLLEQLLARADFPRAGQQGSRYEDYVAAVASLFADDLNRRLKADVAHAEAPQDKIAVLTRFVTVVIDPRDGKISSISKLQRPEFRRMKDLVVDLFTPLNPTFAESLALFRHLTNSGATPATDAFFRRHVEPSFDARAAEAADLSLPRILETGMISSSDLRLSLAKRLLEPGIRDLEESGAEPADLGRLIETLDAYAPQGSLRKDDFLENLAWRLNLEGRELGAFIEDEKSYNWRKGNPLLLRFGSSLAAEIVRLSSRGREEFIRYLMQPAGGRLPAALGRELDRLALREAWNANDSAQYPDPPERVRGKAATAADLMKLQIEAALIDATPFERIPLYELLLSAGGNALKNSTDFPYGVMREFLGYREGSVQETMLAAFLAVVPEHERTVSLAYMLSQAGENKSSVKNLFEVFQTVGIKFGQLSSTWKLFGDEVARETASLKNDARPMSKDAILEIARRELSPQEFARIKRLKSVIGSASLKTVVLVELQDGREVVMMLRRPRAAEQIESNLRLGSDFLKELDRRGLSSSSAMFEMVLDAVRRQLADEVSLTREAEKLRAARRHYDRLNETMRAELGPWKFRVPGLIDGFAVRDTILFVEKADGVAYDRLAPETRAEVGPLIVDASLNTLFRDGWFDADRHTGNQLIDPASHVISPIDFGQATEFSRTSFWRSDDRYELAQFVRAAAAADPSGVLRHGAAMSERAPRDAAALQADVRRILSGGGALQDKIIALVGAFAEQDAPLDGRFTFGAFKGLMTLSAENYMPDAAFRASLAREIGDLLRRKFPQTARDELQARARL